MEPPRPIDALASEATDALALWPALPGLATPSARQKVLALAKDVGEGAVMAWPAAVPAARRRALEVQGRRWRPTSRPPRGPGRAAAGAFERRSG